MFSFLILHLVFRLWNCPRLPRSAVIANVSLSRIITGMVSNIKANDIAEKVRDIIAQYKKEVDEKRLRGEEDRDEVLFATLLALSCLFRSIIEFYFVYYENIVNLGLGRTRGAAGCARRASASATRARE